LRPIIDSGLEQRRSIQLEPEFRRPAAAPNSFFPASADQCDREKAQILPGFSFDGSARIGTGSLNGDQNRPVQTTSFPSSTHVHQPSLRNRFIGQDIKTT
jgi:hypothetical protein